MAAPSRPSGSAGANGSLSPLAKSPPSTSTIEYASSAPAAVSAKHAADGTEDEAIPDHLYAKLPRNFITKGPKGDVPDYLRMILMCELLRRGETERRVREDAGREGGGRRWSSRKRCRAGEEGIAVVVSQRCGAKAPAWSQPVVGLVVAAVVVGFTCELANTQPRSTPSP